jgi:glutamate-1-semialdehyde 2,1-aminomutase
MSLSAAPPRHLCDPATFEVSPADRELFDRQLRGFVPPDAFDAHAHLYDLHTFASAYEGLPVEESRVGFDVYQRWQTEWMGDRCPSDGLFFPYPTPTLAMDAANAFLAQALHDHAGSRGLLMVRPNDDPDRIESQLEADGWAGFKVYHLYSGQADTQESAIGEFLPDWAWEIADRRGLLIMLHLVRRRSLADPGNQQYLRHYCRRFPGAKLVLAHAARGFCGAHTVEGIDGLRGLDNVYFDTSAVCEAHPLEAILRTFGVSRLLYGSDFPIAQLRGKAFSVGDTYHWLYAGAEGGPRQTTLVGIEALLAVRQACRTLGLTDGDVECLFGGNARRLLGITPPPAAPSGLLLYRQAKAVIPGGTQLLSKRPERFAPEQWPAYYREAHGCEVLDLDGRRYLDFSSNGIGANLLGYADPDVTAAVVRRVTLGSNSTLNNPEEVELARLLLQLHPWAEQVRFARTGGESLAVAVRIARAATGREVIAFCGYHGWSDWYLAANLASSSALDGHLLPGLSPAGVPRGLQGTALPFAYNRLDELAALVREHGSRLAAVVLEPLRSAEPASGFLEGVRELCDRCGARLVLDEVTTGFRLCVGGAHLRYGLEPDVAVFAKVLGNGHPMAAIVGKAATLEAAQESFISSSYWTEGVGPAAALATLQKMQRIDVPAHVARIGTRFRNGCQALAERHRLPLRISGPPALTYLDFDHPEADALMTLWTARLLQHGFLAGGAFYPTLAHDAFHVDAFLGAAAGVIDELGESIRRGDTRARLGGPVRQTGFARLT